MMAEGFKCAYRWGWLAWKILGRNPTVLKILWRLLYVKASWMKSRSKVEERWDDSQERRWWRLLEKRSKFDWEMLKQLRGWKLQSVKLIKSEMQLWQQPSHHFSWASQSQGGRWSQSTLSGLQKRFYSNSEKPGLSPQVCLSVTLGIQGRVLIADLLTHPLSYPILQWSIGEAAAQVYSKNRRTPACIGTNVTRILKWAPLLEGSLSLHNVSTGFVPADSGGEVRQSFRKINFFLPLWVTYWPYYFEFSCSKPWDSDSEHHFFASFWGKGDIGKHQ